MEVGEDGVDPDDPEHAGAEDDDDSRHYRLTQAAGGRDGAVHEGRDAVGKAHDAHTLHAGVDDGALGGEEGEELPPEDEQRTAQHEADAEGVGEGNEVALLHAVRLARAVVLTHEAGAGHIERGHCVVYHVVGVGSGGVALDHEGVKGVDTGLDEEVCNGEDGVLESGGQAQRENTLGGGRVEGNLVEVQGVAVLHAGQRPQNEEGRDALGNGTCQRHAHHVQMADDDEEEVEQDVQRARDAQVVQRLFRLANGAEDGVAVVIKSQRRHTEEVHPQVEHGAGVEVFFGVEQVEQGRRTQQADEQEQYAGGDADQQSRVDGLLHIVGMARTVEPGHQHVDAVAQTDEETGEQGDEDAGGAYRAEGRGACEPAHHSHVRHIKEHLQQIGQDQRQADQEDLFGQRPFGQRLCG